MYDETPDKDGKIIGGAATLLYFVTVAALLLFLKFSVNDITTDQGIMINFGDTEAAAPGSDLAFNEEPAPDSSPAAQPSASDEEETLTQDTEDAPAVKPATKPEKKPKKKTPTTTQTTPKPKPAETKPVEKPRQADKRALFPGKTDGSTAKSDGNAEGTGNQGKLTGRVDGSYDGTGIGTSGSAIVEGRRLLGSLPNPDYGAKDEGKVVVEITVNQQGVVTRADYRPNKSTTNNSVLVNAALKAARKARFNIDETDDVIKKGTITYTFKQK